MIRIKKVLKTIVKIIIVLFLTSLFIELCLRIIPKDKLKIDFSLASDIRLFDSTRVFSYKTDSQRAWVGLGPPTIWYFNNYGFRDRSFPQNQIDSKLYKIAFIGDSIIMGVGVEDHQTMPSFLDQTLRPKKFTGGDTQFFRVYNLGLWGSSPLIYEALLNNIGNSIKPDLIVVTHHSEDTTEDFIFDKDRKYNFFMGIPDTFIPYPISEFLKKNSYLYLVLLKRYYQLIEPLKYTKDPTPSDIEKGWEINGQALNNMNLWAKKNGAKLLLLGIPTIDEVKLENPDDRVKNIKKYITEKYKINYLDLEEYIRSIPDPTSLFVDQDNGHFNPEGNQKMAEFIAEYLKSNKIIPGVNN